MLRGLDRVGNRMVILIAGLVVFFSVHLARVVAPGFRDRQNAANPGRWRGLYSLASLIGFALIIWGWIAFRPEAPEVYSPPAWGRHAASLLVVLAFILLVAAYRPAGYIKKWVKHPMLAGVALWSIGHLLANGDLASVLLFGSFLAYAIVDRIAVIPRGDPAPAVKQPRADVIAVVAGLVAFAVFGFWLHGFLFGVSPLG
jgi:uncharacterized membrane protein